MAWEAVDGDGNLAYKFGEQPKGSALRLSLLAIHISETRQKISDGNSSVQGKSHDYDYLNDYLKRLEAQEAEETAAAPPSPISRSTSWTRGRAR